MSDETMMWDEVADIGALLHELDDEAFDTPSLCDGWAVREVLGHMALGHTLGIGGFPLYAFRLDARNCASQAGQIIPGVFRGC